MFEGDKKFCDRCSKEIEHSHYFLAEVAPQDFMVAWRLKGDGGDNPLFCVNCFLEQLDTADKPVLLKFITTMLAYLDETEQELEDTKEQVNTLYESNSKYGW